ncbi:TauD/TfdA family dioxygenase [Burkholderia sp. L27(2015)]|uniref:TauD/TfdA family dioxygenase n=1 Tax=Burkholderia sp. L27(2015) TaxID=1641858 RepID=UPI00131B5F86|nr:TauD/TfdA family dioxygenase [Burkholderia sp. L27(2015)]
MSQAFQPRAWYSEDLQRDSSWVMRLNEQEATGFSTALEHAKSLGKPMLSMTADDFPLGEASLAALQRAFVATQGRWGLCLLKGFPVNAWSAEDARLAFWGMGLHVGVARTQNRASEIMNDVRNEGGSYKTKGGRGYNTNAALDFHADSCDVVGLLCLQPAKSGGQSKITSTMAVRDEIARRRPDLIAALQGPFYHSYQGTQSPDQPPFYNCPILGSLPDYFAFRANRKNTHAAQRDFPEVPRLTQQQLEVLALIDELTADPQLCFSMWLESGDLQLLNNYVMLHSRTEFEDFDEPEKRRHLLRLWLSIPQAQPLPPQWEEYFGDVRPGSVRGGVRGSYITAEFLEYEARQAQRMHMMLK